VEMRLDWIMNQNILLFLSLTQVEEEEVVVVVLMINHSMSTLKKKIDKR
jgi:hypothetical protein